MDQLRNTVMVTVTWACFLCFYSSILIPSACARPPNGADRTAEIASHVVSPLLLPRKLRVVVDEVAAVTIRVHRNDIVDDHLVPTPDPCKRYDDNEHKRDGVPSTLGKSYKEKKGKDVSRTEDEGNEATQFFTMDYSHVKKRRPIHNKSFPVGP